ncbi:hypothetical protein BX600DRAFT_505949 [Xylariales sp. PMI_506]|nr:hypothetical protein BX600DRAFT_505949 [Xylariales sp. PMI_506]
MAQHPSQGRYNLRSTGDAMPTSSAATTTITTATAAATTTTTTTSNGTTTIVSVNPKNSHSAHRVHASRNDKSGGGERPRRISGGSGISITAPTFPQFGLLPGEIRLLVWEFYFAATPRIHVIHEAGSPPWTATPRRDEHLDFCCTTLDAATNIAVPVDGPRCHASVCHEARAVASALGCHRGGRRTSNNTGNSGGGGVDELGRAGGIAESDGQGKDKLSSASLRPLPAPQPRVCLTRLVAGRRFGGPRDDGTGMGSGADRQPVSALGTTDAGRATTEVDWEADLLFVCSTSSEQAFRSLGEQAWAHKVHRLAVLVPSRAETDIPFGPGYIVSHTLRSMVALTEVYVVMIPSHVHRSRSRRQSSHHRGNAAEESLHEDRVKNEAIADRFMALKRDAFGFVPYVDYLKEIGVTTAEMTQGRHLTYQRTALSFKQALQYHLDWPHVKLQKVVDVDCLMLGESSYHRRQRLNMTTMEMLSVT